MKILSFPTKFIGKECWQFYTLDSTSLYALNILSKNNPKHGTVISTYEQTAGRGQIGSYWESEAFKNINISIILYPDFLAAQQQFLLNQWVSLGVYDFLSDILPTNVKIKWPNDLYVNNKKIGGILIQNNILGSNLHSSVIGIGININQIQFESNPPNPTSLNLELRRTFDIIPLMEQLFLSLEKHYHLLENRQLHYLKSAYLKHLYRFQSTNTYERTNTGELFDGKIIDINNQGKLVILNSKDIVEEFDFKQIKTIF